MHRAQRRYHFDGVTYKIGDVIPADVVKRFKPTHVTGAEEEAKTSPPLTYVNGIGDAMATKLESEGVATVADLASLSDERIEELSETVSGASVRSLRQWRKVARQL